jgi:hypothetical protein
LNINQALSKLRKILGKNAAIQDNRTPSSPEAREADKIIRDKARDRRNIARENVEQRRAAVLAADAEYQACLLESKAAQTALDRIGIMPRYRYTAGRNMDYFFRVEAEADTLADLVECAEQKLRVPVEVKGAA